MLLFNNIKSWAKVGLRRVGKKNVCLKMSSTFLDFFLSVSFFAKGQASKIQGLLRG